MKLVTYTKRQTPPPIEGEEVFHSSTFFNVLKRVPGCSPYLVVAFDEAGRPAGSLLGLVSGGLRWPRLPWFRRCVVYGQGDYFGTPPAEREALFGAMLERLTHDAGRHCFCIKFRHIETPLWGYRHFRAQGYVPRSILRVYNSLHSRTPEASIAPRYRRHLTRAAQAGATAAPVRDEAEAQATFALMQRNLRSRLSRFFPGRKLLAALTQLNCDGHEHLRLFCVKAGEKIIGGALCVYSRQRAYLLFSTGLSKSYPKLHPGIVVVWEALKQAHRAGYPHFEFLDAGQPAQRRLGYLHFIRNFGGKQAGSRSWTRYRWRWINFLLEKIYV